MNLRWPEILILVFIVILLFGAKRLPDLAKSIGKSIKEFKKATNSADESESSADEDSTPKNGSVPSVKADVAKKN